VICTNKINCICIAQSHQQVVVKDMPLDMALGAFGLIGTVNYSTMHYRVSKARAKGTYDLARAAFVAALVTDCAKKNQDIGGLVIDLTKNTNTDGANSLDLSSVRTGTMVTLATAGSSDEVLSVSSESPKKKKQSRTTFRQASLEKLETKRTKTDYDSRYKAAFKDATKIVAAARVASDVIGDEESVLGMLDRLNSIHKLDEKKKLSNTTVYRAVDEGRTGMSPLKKVQSQEFLKTSLNW
jgi:hypothetical protein